MKPLRILPAIFFVAALLGGCASSSPVTDADDSVAVDSSVVHTQAIHVLVDGDDRGTVPRTVRIRRSFGTQQISLWQAGKEIRIYEMQISNTSAGDQTLQGFWSTPSADGASFDVQTLPKRGDMIYSIPYAAYPIRIEDNQYGVTLLVSE